jgi:hypothetical protein
MKQPEGYQENNGKTCRLKKALYGLKQAPLLWNKKITSFPKTQNMTVNFIIVLAWTKI